MAVGAKNTLCLVKVFSGSARDGLVDCEGSLDIARNAGDAGLLTRTMLALALAALQSGDTERALQLANDSQERAVVAGQKETEWRAGLVAARANQLRGNSTIAQEQKGRAETAYTAFRNSLGDYISSYEARKDVIIFRKQLDQ